MGRLESVTGARLSGRSQGGVNLRNRFFKNNSSGLGERDPGRDKDTVRRGERDPFMKL